MLGLLTDLSILRYSFSQAVSPIDGEATTERPVSEGARKVLPAGLAPKNDCPCDGNGPGVCGHYPGCAWFEWPAFW